jgi:fibronectin type 3 domain-containing protein
MTQAKVSCMLARGSGFGWNRAVPFVVLTFMALAGHGAALGQTTFPSQIGVEVADRPTGFIDAFKDQGRLFVDSSGNPLPCDANGNPLSDGIAVVFDNRPVPEWLGYSDDPAAYQPNSSGTYTLSFQGQATLSNVAGAPVLTFANQAYNAATNTTTVNVTLPGGATFADGPALMEISFTNTQLTPTSAVNTGIAALQAILPGFTLAQAASPTQVFDPAFLASTAPFGYLRFMNWLGTNTNPGYYGDSGHHLLPWSTRSLPTDFYQGVGTSISTNANLNAGAWGVSWEYVLLLANATNKDIWINIPMTATGGADSLDPTYVASPDTSSYIYNLAYLLKHGDAFTGNVGLNPGLHIYIEHSNEVWNSGFLQYTWNLLAAQDEVARGGSVLNNDGDTSQYDWAYRRHLKRLYEIGQIFQSVFGAGSLNTTIRPVYGWWQLDEGATSNAAKTLAWFSSTYGPPANYFYAMAQGDYFDQPNYATDTTIPEVLSDMTTASNASVKYVVAGKATAAQYGLQLFAYEGGPSNNDGGTNGTTNTGIQILANRDPGMDTLVQTHIRTNWFGNGGGLYGYFGLSGAYSRYGDWGATDDYNNLTTAKYNALLNLTGYQPSGVPLAPGPLVATPGNSSIALHWPPVSGAANYKVLRGLTSGAETALATVSSASYTDTAVANGTTYYYEVTAVNPSGTSAPSNEVSATPATGTPLPPVLTATAGNAQVVLTWTAATGAASYNVYEGTTSGGESSTPVATGVAATTYTVTGLANGTIYYFEVAAVNSAGTGAVSNQASSVPVGPPPAPAGLTASIGNAQTVLTWTASSGATSYNVYQGAASGGESSTPIATGITASTYTVTGLTDGTAYFFTVTAVNSAGTSSYSNEARVTPALPNALLAYEPFGEAVGLMNGATGNGDTGWNAGWVDQGTDANPGYDIVATTPLTYPGLLTTGQYAVGGNTYNYIGRQLNVSATGPFASYLSGRLIGAPGQTLWLSFLIRKDTASGGTSNLLNLTAQGNGSAWLVSPANVAAGFCGSDFGGGSTTSSIKYWSLIAGANFSCTSAIQTNVPIVVGQPALMVMQITFGATNTVKLYVNPNSLGGAAPATPSATYSTTNSLAFQSLTYYGGDGSGQSSLAGIRVGASFAAVTPVALPIIPPAPGGLTATAGNSQATLAWTTVTGAASYNVYQGTTSGGESTTPVASGITTPSYTATGLTNGTAYYFEIAAVNSAGTGAVSNEASVTPSGSSGIPSAPVLTATSGDSTATLSWTASSGATSYNVYQSTTSGAEGTTPIATGVTATTDTLSGLTDAKTYFFKVAAVNSSGASALSNEVAATPAAPVGGTNAPANFSIYPQVVAAHPVNAGFNMQPAADANTTENAWLADGGFSPYDIRMSFTASMDGSATTFIATGNGGTSFYSSVTTGYFVGATARTYRYSAGAWSLLRTDTVTGYTALDDATPADNTITFASSGPQILTGDITWLQLDNQLTMPGLTLLDPRFTTYCTNWSTETLGCDTRTATLPYTLSTDVPPSDTGGLSLELADPNTETQGIWQYIQGAFIQPNYEEFQPGHTYQVDVWLKQSGISNSSVTFSIRGLGISHTFTGVSGTWQEFTWSFPAVSGLAAGSAVSNVHLDFNAPGTMWVDNFQLYDAAWPPNTVNPQVMTAWQNYQPGTVRIWSNFGNASQNYSFFSLNSWLTPEIKTRNTPGIGNQYEVPGELEHLPNALANVKTIGANPWLIVNMALSEVEWGELIDYLAAPAGTGYAAMRPADHPGPYTADFSTIYLEVGNEEWGTQHVAADAAYGQWAHYVISNAIAGKSYFNASKIKFVMNGFNLLPAFGSAAIAAAPEASVVDAALYTQGNQALSGDAYYQSDLVQVPVSNGPIIDAIASQQQLDAASGRNYSLAAYEEGPGQDTAAYSGDPSLAAAIGAIDVNLYASMRGFGPQNLFMYQLGSGPYTSHTNFANGFRPHPVWEALELRNNYCSGPMVLTNTNSVPTYSDATVTSGQAVPLIAVYTFQDAHIANQADVVVISRDLNNSTPVTLNFPATPTGSATLYTLTGDPRANNNQALNIPIASQTVTVTTNYTFSMPAGSMYVFQVPLSGTWSSTGQPTPAPPVSLTASAGNAEVTLTWPASTGATGYNVLRATTTGGPYAQIGTTASVAYTDTSVTNATTYYYVVQGTNGGGASGNSPEASATPNVEDDSMTATPPPLDGSNTGAWANAQFVPLSHYFAGASPDTAQYKTLWDSNYLYVLVSVQDPYLVAPTQANIYHGETVELYFSGTDTRSTTYGPTDFQYAFPYGNGGAVVTESFHSPASLTGIVFGQQNIAGGFQMVMALPWTTLGTTPVVGQQYGLDLMVDTATAQNTRIGKLAWWATCDCTWDNPSNMGPLLLTKSAIQSQTITFTPPPAQVTFGVPPITLSATATSGLPVTFSLLSGPATVSGSTLTINGAGTIVIAANQAGNSSYPAAAQVQQTVLVNQANVTVTLGGLAQTYTGSPLAATAATTPAGLAVTLTYNGSAAPPTAASAYTVVATIADANYTGSASGTLTIAKAASSVTFSANPATPTQGQPANLTAIATGTGQVSGNVVFSSGTTALCTATLNASGIGTCSFVPSTDNYLAITAQYPGDLNHLSSSTALTVFVYDSAIQLNAANTQLTYPGATNLTACITPTTAIGTVQIYDGTTLLTTQTVQGGGCANWYISPGLTAGTHSLRAAYLGNATIPAGVSVPITITVNPVPVVLSPACWNATFPYGANYQCTVTVSSNAGAPLGSITYIYDSGSPASVPLSNGNAQFILTKPTAGTHTVVISYSQQTNYAAAPPQTETFTVTAAPVIVSLTPSSWYTHTGTSITFQAAVSSWSAGPPNANGNVSFYDGSTLLATVPVSAAGQASYISSGLPVGGQTITATYADGTNYASGSSSITITIAQ